MSYDKLRSIIKEALSTLTAESKADGYKDPAYRATIKQFKGKKVSKEEFAQALAMHHKSMDEDTEGKLTEGKTFKPGDMWSDDFDYRGMIQFGAKYKKTGDYKKDIKVMKALHNSFEDVNYHSESKPLWDAMKLYTSAFAAKKRSMETYRKLADQCDIKLKEFNKNCAKTLRTIKDGINEISAKAGLEDVIMGRTTAIEGIKLSVGLADEIRSWLMVSPFGRRYGQQAMKGNLASILPIMNSYDFGKKLSSKLKSEWKTLYAKHGPKKEAVIEQLKELQTIDEHHNDEDFPGKDLTAWELLDKIKPANLDLYNKVEDFMKSMNEDYSQRARNFRVNLRKRLESMKSGKKISYGKLSWTKDGSNFKDSKGKTVPSEDIVKDLKLAVKQDILKHKGADGSTMVNAYLKFEGKLNEDKAMKAIVKAPKGTEAHGGGHSPFTKLGHNSWKNYKTKTLAHDKNVWSRFSGFRDFELKKGKVKYFAIGGHQFEGKLNEYMDINDPILIAVRARATMIAKAKAAPKVKKISTKQYYKLMDKEIDLIQQMKDAAKDYERLDSEMNQDAGQKGDAWTDADANRYGGDLNKLQTRIEKLAKQKLDVKKQIMNYRVN